MTARRASCCCGALSAEAEGEPAAISLCHCLECQRRTGAPFGIGAYYDAGQVRLGGASTVYERTVGSRKLAFHFCPRCGSTVYWTAENHPGRVGIAVGAFGDPHFPKPMRSVFERSRHQWIEMPADIAGFSAGRDSTPSRRA
ncbi:MAG: GFA family protein [Alphaproteobacteria bacterium]|nr:GFA family protein [Alphaproteobacteria bacterium]MBV9693265.1 GFA family protein [Alphaproteobacteria bacterium]